MVRRVIFYRSHNNRCPVEDFLDELPSKSAQKVVWVLKLIEELEVLPQKFFKKVQGSENLWEVRVKLGSDIFRLFAFFDSYKQVILTHGFAKKTDKLPKNEIDKALVYQSDYLKRT